MSWFFIVFFGILALAAAVYGLSWLRKLLAKPQNARAELTQRTRERFPMTAGFVRRDRTDYYLTFRLLDTGEELKLETDQDMYDLLTTGMKGQLTWQGNWFRFFMPDSGFDILSATQPLKNPENVEEKDSPAPANPTKAGASDASENVGKSGIPEGPEDPEKSVTSQPEA